MVAGARDGARPDGARRGVRPLALTGLVYLVASLLLWWHAWTGGPGSTLATGSTDPAQGVWFLAWVPHALGQGSNPLFSRAMFFPGGLNLLSNASALLVGLLLAPVTVIFGPVTAFTVAVTLAPAADALAAFVVLRRFTSWVPAAFVGGLLFGFGPFVATDLRIGHLNFTVALIAPALLLLFERVARGPAEGPWRAGLLLAALVVGEFFVSLELLAVVLIVGVTGAVIAAAATRDRRRFGRLAVALVVGGVVAGGALAYPLWWYLAGPRHFSGAVFGSLGRGTASLESFVVPHGQLNVAGILSSGNVSYLGVPLLLVLGAGGWIWRADRVLRLALVLAGISALLSLGATLHVGQSDTHIPLPAWPLVHLPVLSSIAAMRFALCTDLLCALALVRVLDHAHEAARGTGRRGLGLFVPAVVAAAALLPAALAASWPYRTAHLVKPTVLRDVASSAAVVREFPLPHGVHAEGLVWQAEAGFSYSLTDGYAIVPGTGGHATVDPVTGPLGEVLVGVSLGRQRPPFSKALVDGVRANAWGQGATIIVVLRGDHYSAVAADLLRTALGPPASSDGSGWLWRRPST